MDIAVDLLRNRADHARKRVAVLDDQIVDLQAQLDEAERSRAEYLHRLEEFTSAADYLENPNNE